SRHGRSTGQHTRWTASSPAPSRVAAPLDTPIVVFYRSFYRVPDRPDPAEQEDLPCKDTSPASATATTRSSTKDSIPSPARNAAPGTPPAPTAPKPSASSHASPPNETAATTKSGHSPSAPTSPATGCPPSASSCAPARTAVTSTRPNATSCPPSDVGGFGGFAPKTSKGSTTRCCTPPTGPGPWPPRPSTRCTSSSAVPSTTHCDAGSSPATSP